MGLSKGNTKNKKRMKDVSLAVMGGALLLGGSTAFAAGEPTTYTLQGDCAFLPAARATEFHGNAEQAGLRLGMAGNQWVVFEAALQAYNLYRGEDNTQPEYRTNAAGATWTLADLQVESNQIYTQLVPPGQIRKQIKSGCMTLGNDEDRNFLPGNIQVDFDVFASTNYNLMQDLANNGFIDEAVPYIANRLDLMVGVGNPEGIGSTTWTGDAAFDTQWDIAMDLLDGSIVASSLDHINEGIHNASNGYMKKVDAYINTHAEASTPIMRDYTLGDGTYVPTTTKTAAEWLEFALQAVRIPSPTSPGALRLVSLDAGENHTSHDMDLNSCGSAADLVFCEYAVLNKHNTHESRVHHVETPGGIQGHDGFIPVHVGYVWITELAYQLNHMNFAVQGMVGNQDIADLGIPSPNGVNGDKIYSLALLATSKNQKRGREFINFLRSPEGQTAYTDGGFTGLTAGQLDGGRCYTVPAAGGWSARTGAGSCPDPLGNGNF